MTDFTDFAENALIDLVLRGQTPTLPTNWSIALLTAAPTDTGSLTAEVSTSSTGYARQSVARSLAAWSGTQGAGTTVASSGTGGRSSNNATITFGPATASWGTITHVAWVDGSGNAWITKALTSSRTVSSGDSLIFNPDTLALTIA